MKCFKHKFLFGLLLNVVIHLESVDVSLDAEDENLGQRFLRNLENTLGKLPTKIENTTCRPLPPTITDCKTLDLYGSNLQENCQKEDAPCYSWNIAFIAGGKKFMVFIGYNDDKKKDIKVTCNESESIEQMRTNGTTEMDNEQEHMTTVSISEGVYNPSTRRKQPPPTDNSILETDDGKDSASVIENTSDEEMETGVIKWKKVSCNAGRNIHEKY
ncbi:uncharacterized protein LOC134270677 [Saccostrea cucullata]|uniref:uncharacterized protein LOC134270677 n=1 Tax=Saccostrea cuccullata TaxID=36930 RepID=UPI002ECFD1A2